MTYDFKIQAIDRKTGEPSHTVVVGSWEAMKAALKVLKRNMVREKEMRVVRNEEIISKAQAYD